MAVENLEKLEKSVETMTEQMTALIKTLTEGAVENVEKGGAKFSKATMTQLKTMRDAINKLLEGTDKEDDDDEKKDAKKNLTPEEMRAAIMKGIKGSMAGKEEAPAGPDIGGIVTAVIEKIAADNKKKDEEGA